MTVFKVKWIIFLNFVELLLDLSRIPRKRALLKKKKWRQLTCLVWMYGIPEMLSCASRSLIDDIVSFFNLVILFRFDCKSSSILLMPAISSSCSDDLNRGNSPSRNCWLQYLIVSFRRVPEMDSNLYMYCPSMKPSMFVMDSISSSCSDDFNRSNSRPRDSWLQFVILSFRGVSEINSHFYIRKPNNHSQSYIPEGDSRSI